MLGPVWGAELKKMCFQIGYNIIREITPLPPQWSLPTEFKYSLRVGMGFYLLGDREKERGKSTVQHRSEKVKFVTWDSLESQRK